MYLLLSNIFKAPRMCSEVEFIKCLTTLGHDLAKQPTREAKSTYLYSQLSLINKNLPAKVWIPLYNCNHHVLSIPPSVAAVLNSKDKVVLINNNYYYVFYFLIKYTQI